MNANKYPYYICLKQRTVKSHNLLCGCDKPLEYKVTVVEQLVNYNDVGSY